MDASCRPGRCRFGLREIWVQVLFGRHGAHPKLIWQTISGCAQCLDLSARNGEMKKILERLAADVGLAEPENSQLRLRFAPACASRVRHLLEEPGAVSCLDALGDFVEGKLDGQAFDAFVVRAAATANQHRGSGSLDGSAHAAVSATYAVAMALAGKALEAASYAVYATVYAYGGYAVSDPEAFEAEFAWQAETLDTMAHTLLIGPSDTRT